MKFHILLLFFFFGFVHALLTPPPTHTKGIRVVISSSTYLILFYYAGLLLRQYLNILLTLYAWTSICSFRFFEMTIIQKHKMHFLYFIFIEFMMIVLVRTWLRKQNHCEWHGIKHLLQKLCFMQLWEVVKSMKTSVSASDGGPEVLKSP